LSVYHPVIRDLHGIYWRTAIKGTVICAIEDIGRGNDVDRERYRRNPWCRGGNLLTASGVEGTRPTGRAVRTRYGNGRGNLLAVGCRRERYFCACHWTPGRIGQPNDEWRRHLVLLHGLAVPADHGKCFGRRRVAGAPAAARIDNAKRGQNQQAA